MELTLSELDIENTVLLDTNGYSRYRTHTKLLQLVPRETLLFRAVANDPSGELHIGTVSLGAFRDDFVVVNGRDVTPARMRLMSLSQTFAASDGRAYKWKVDSGQYTLVDDSTKEVIAYFERHFFLSSKTNKVHISNQGLPVLEEILATLIFMVAFQRRRKRRRDNGWVA
ncbi:hypothetical protein HDZ31DRAFT_34105 [Schizophyllum fasciatum]